MNNENNDLQNNDLHEDVGVSLEPSDAGNEPDAEDAPSLAPTDEDLSISVGTEPANWTEEAIELVETLDLSLQQAITDPTMTGEGDSAEVPDQFEDEGSDYGTPDDAINASREEIKPVIECLLFVAEEPLSLKVIGKVLGTVPEEEIQQTLATLIAEYDERSCGLEIREVAGGWRISTRPQHHDFIRKYLKTRPSAWLSLPALETLAVIAYKQPITVPEILEIRGVSSSSAIKTLLEKRLIITKGRKETVGRPMMYGTSREFLIQFGLKDLSELPSIEDFEDLAQ